MPITIRNIIDTVLNIWMAVVSFFLGFRIIFELFAANRATPFVSWVYDVSSSLMSPFAGIFPNLNLGGGSYFDIVAVISLIAYAVVNYIILAIIDTVATPTTVITQERTRVI
jgi:hypothetical protein